MLVLGPGRVGIQPMAIGDQRVEITRSAGSVEHARSALDDLSSVVSAAVESHRGFEEVVHCGLEVPSNVGSDASLNPATSGAADVDSSAFSPNRRALHNMWI